MIIIISYLYYFNHRVGIIRQNCALPHLVLIYMKNLEKKTWKQVSSQIIADFFVQKCGGKGRLKIWENSAEKVQLW